MSHAHSPAHVRFDVVKEETDVDISARDKALEATIQHARELSSPRHSLLAHGATLREPSAAAYLSSSDSFSSLPVDEDPAPYPVLCSLLSSSSTFAIEYKGSLSNHLPHALISLYHLGASSRRLMAYSALYSERLEPARGLEEERWETAWDEAAHRGSGDDDDVTDSNHNSMESRGRRSRSEPVTISATNWQRFLGQKRHFLSYARFFQGELQQRIDAAEKRPPSAPAAAEMETEGSAEDVVHSSLTPAQSAAVQSLVSTYAPLLIAGGSHSALHPLIHCGWGLCVGAAGLPTVCEGLAYLCYAYHSLDGHTGGYSAASLASLPQTNALSLLAALKATGVAFAPRLEEMDAAVRRIPYNEMQISTFQRKLVWLGTEAPDALLRCDSAVALDVSAGIEPLLATLLRHVLLLFAVSGDDFFLLHTVTATFALAHIARLLSSSDAVLALRYGVKYALATWIAQGLPGLEVEGVKKAMGSGRIEDAVEWALASVGRQDGRRWDAVSWEELRAAAADSDDEHTQKVVHVAWDRARHGDCRDLDRSLCRLVAWKRLTDENDDLFRT